MKKLLPVFALLSGIAILASCNKGDDNPYGDWKCTCFVTKMVYLTPSDTVRSPILDTVYIAENDMDKNTAKAFCQKSATSYKDTIGGMANCILK
jgi:hypothetical protein